MISYRSTAESDDFHAEAMAYVVNGDPIQLATFSSLPNVINSREYAHQQ